MDHVLWQLYDHRGRPIEGVGKTKQQVVLEGALHATVHLWIWRQTATNIEVLLQKRAATKLNWPGRLDKSAGGHIRLGEEPVAAALRKAQGELGLSVPPERLSYLGMTWWHSPIGETELVENECQWLYALEYQKSDVTLNPLEVECTKWEPLETLHNATIDPGDMTDRYVPYDQSYFSLLYEAIGRLAR